MAEQGSSPSLIWRSSGPAHGPQKEQALAQQAERGIQTGSQLQRLQNQPAALQTGETTGQPGCVTLSFPTISRLMQAAKNSKPPRARPNACVMSMYNSVMQSMCLQRFRCIGASPHDMIEKCSHAMCGDAHLLQPGFAGNCC